MHAGHERHNQRAFHQPQSTCHFWRHSNAWEQGVTILTMTPNRAAGASLVLGRVSLVLFILLSVFLVAFGLLYASVHDMLWFHAAAVPESIRGEVRPLYLALMKLIGGSSMALGILAGYVAMAPMRRGAPWAGSVLAVCIAIPVIMAAYVAETLAKLTGAPTSWHIMGILLAIDALALGLHALSRRAVQS